MDAIKALLEQVKQSQQKSKEKISQQIFKHDEILLAFLSSLNHLSIKRTGNDFVLDAENEFVINCLTMYFNDDPKFEAIESDSSVKDGRFQPYAKNWKLKKGLWISGNFGSGKTMMLQAAQKITGTQKTQFGLKSCDEMNQLFLKKQYEGIDKYSKKVREGEKRLDFCFDDLGEEEMTVNHYGNKVCIMASVLSERYRNYLSHGLITHITTNKTIPDVKEHYGGRIHSRITEMFNVVVLGAAADSKDRRKLTGSIN